MIRISALLVFALALPALAHSGRTDKDGCHVDSKTGGRHCHEGPVAPAPSAPSRTAAQPVVSGAAPASQRHVPTSDGPMLPQVLVDRKERAFHSPGCKFITPAMSRLPRSVAKMQNLSPAKECAETDAEAEARWKGRSAAFTKRRGGLMEGTAREAASELKASTTWTDLEEEQRDRRAAHRRRLESTTVYTGDDGSYHASGCSALYRTERYPDGTAFQRYVGTSITLATAFDGRVSAHSACSPPSYQESYSD